MEGFLVYANVDKNGNIKEGLSGFNIIPDRQYDYFFFLDKEIDLMDYKIENNKLVKI